jgi:polar amino acid transport system substrate-binding protein
LDDVLSRGTIRIAVIGGNPPYSNITVSGEPEGYDIDIGKKIAAALNVGNVPVSVELLNWAALPASSR